MTALRFTPDYPPAVYNILLITMRLKALQVLLIPKSVHQRERILRQIFRLARFNFDKAFFCHFSLVYRGIEGL